MEDSAARSFSTAKMNPATIKMEAGGEPVTATFSPPLSIQQFAELMRTCSDCETSQKLRDKIAVAAGKWDVTYTLDEEVT